MLKLLFGSYFTCFLFINWNELITLCIFTKIRLFLKLFFLVVVQINWTWFYNTSGYISNHAGIQTPA